MGIRGTSSASAATSATGLSLPASCALVFATFSVTWPIAQAVDSINGRVLVALPFALGLALGLAFVGMLVGRMWDLGNHAVTGRVVRVPAAVVTVLALCAVLLGVWFGRVPVGG